MKHYSLTVWSDWQYCCRERVDVTFIRCNLDYFPECWASIDFVLLGFGISLTRFSPAPVENQGRGA